MKHKFLKMAKFDYSSRRETWILEIRFLKRKISPNRQQFLISHPSGIFDEAFLVRPNYRSVGNIDPRKVLQYYNFS
jgi:hypothetical protein